VIAGHECDLLLRETVLEPGSRAGARSRARAALSGDILQVVHSMRARLEPELAR